MTVSDNRKRRYFNGYDAALIVLLAALALVIMLCLDFGVSDGSYACVYVDSEPRGEYPLYEDREIVIEGYNGSRNVLVIEDGRAYMKEASCPDRLCMHQGRIDKSGQTIVCLPNRVVIEIKNGEGGGYDAITQ